MGRTYTPVAEVFFRRVKQGNLVVMRTPIMPLDTAILRDLVQVSQPWDPSVVESVPKAKTHPGLRMPSDEELRHFSRVPRSKSPGADGLPPYLVYMLPPAHFNLYYNGIRLSLMSDCAMPNVF